ncbi:AraC family transcriptional regulator [Aestuariibacter halophilus]|uniref:AraC family transcriptional regulator n=1 Tax=Fluctibacter halophilus TaxID=226011 RepID=A0ABS8G6G8_9ALTE|nr:AraC family transcriptional regulator [Aestuariibacter halophilus]MCC2616177.1 AraC family transcriptional regulator [Aestuariibacter halophilus]
MKTVTAYYAAALLRFAQQAGFDMTVNQSHNQRVLLVDQDRAWGALADALGPSLGVDFGAQLKPTDLGTLGHLLLSLDTLGQALHYVQRYYPLVGEGGEITVSHEGAHTALVYIPHYQVARAVRVEAVLASIASIAAQISEGQTPLVQMSLDYRAEPQVVEKLQRLAGQPVRDGQSCNALIFDRQRLSGALQHANGVVANSMVAILNADLAALSDISARDKVIRLLREQPNLDRAAVAERMHLSQRTLCRQLKQQHTTFAALKQQVLCRLAEDALDSGESVSTVAERLGYSDASAFIKAFKGWRGTTPRRASAEKSA